MKQHITIDQLNELTEKAKERLSKYWVNLINNVQPDPTLYALKGDLQLLSIGQMIEFLGWPDMQIYEGKKPTKYMQKKYPGKSLDLWIIQDGDYENAGKLFQGSCICDAFWEACKEILEK